MISQCTEFVAERTGETCEYGICNCEQYLNCIFEWRHSKHKGRSFKLTNGGRQTHGRQNEQTSAGDYWRIQGTSSARRDTSLPTALAQSFETKR